MKKMLFMAAALLAAAACTQEQIIPDEPETGYDGPISVTLVADNPGTRTELGRENSVLKPYWSAGDNILIVRIPNPDDEEDDYEYDDEGRYLYHPFSSGLTQRALSSSFEGSVDLAGQYRAFYPEQWEEERWGEMQTVGPQIDDYFGLCFEIPSVQYPSATSFDKHADLLVSAPFTIEAPGDKALGFQGQEIPIRFNRANAIVKVKFNPTEALRERLAGQKVRSVSFNTRNAPREGEEGEKAIAYAPRTRADVIDNYEYAIGLTGSVHYSLSYIFNLDQYDVNNVNNDEYSYADYNTYVFAKYTDDTAYLINSTNEDEATYFCVFPSILKNYVWDDDDNSWEGLYIRVETDDYVITREIKLPSVGIALQPSVVTTFNISLTEDNVSEIVQKGISIDKSEMVLMPGDGRFVDLKAEVLSFPRNTIYSNTDFQEYFSVSPAEFSLRYVEYGEIDYNSSDANSEYISHVYLSVDDEVEAGEYDVTITYDGQYSTTCRVSVITDSKKIVFTDPNVKAICVNAWGGHLYPEELTEYEASKVTTLRNPDNEWKSYFMGNTDIVSFDEFEYFTGMTGIDQSAFEGCSLLESIKLPKSITRIDDSNYSTGCAFMNCISLSSVNLSACTALEMIGEHAFEGCSSLQTIVIPASVKYISSDAFRYCKALTTVTIPENSQLESLHGNGYSDPVNSSSRHGAFFGCQSLQSIWLPPTLKQIGQYAFANCIALTSINIPESVIALDSYAFYDCRALQHISIPGSVRTISEGAFYDCYNLSEVILHEGLKTIGIKAFSYCTGLHELEFPASLTTIGYYRNESIVFYGVEFRSGTDNQGNEYHGVKFKGSTPPSFERADIKISGKHWDDTANDGAGAWVDGVNVYVPAGSKAAYEAINGVTDGGKNTVIEF